MAEKKSKKIIAGNWKMNPKSISEAVKLFQEVKNAAQELQGVTSIIFPPSVFLGVLAQDLQTNIHQSKALKAKSKTDINSNQNPKEGVRGREKKAVQKVQKKSGEIFLGAQNVFWEIEGAFTGEVSPFMLSSLGVKDILIGHSERRALGDTDAAISRKMQTALRLGFRVTLCIGEHMRDEEGEYFRFIERQIESAFSLLGETEESPEVFLKQVTIAYEPIWAISSTKKAHPASPADYFGMSIFIRKTLADMFGSVVARDVPILYGGSVNEADAMGFLKEGDGVLVGHASLEAKSFSGIMKQGESFFL